MAIEEANYKILRKDGPFELRRYDPYLLAETIISGEMEEASSKAFRRLFNYISGSNHSKSKVAMTAPVSLETAGEKISMTTPVSQERMDDAWAISFMMPASYTESTIPVPDDSRVRIRVVPAKEMAIIRYSGRWTSSRYEKHKQELELWISSQGLTIAGEAIWARFNAPFTPWFMRRNEVQIPVTSVGMP
ncbi:MAG: heme-binding protein [Candidatus Marinimicrobia bacterium]|nr:heme-binding protein [Candidatus Neomarinimicrobiota bacterium]